MHLSRTFLGFVPHSDSRGMQLLVCLFFKISDISIRFQRFHRTVVFFRSEINICSSRFCCNYNNPLIAVEDNY